ncbi:MAG: YkuD protein [Patescibacteria group bacterium]|nr:YkuD protein [Patescibacteria group bacterium]
MVFYQSLFFCDTHYQILLYIDFMLNLWYNRGCISTPKRYSLCNKRMSNEKKSILFLAIICGTIFFLSYKNASSIVVAKILPQTETVLNVSSNQNISSQKQETYEYLEITESCGPDFEGHCIPVYAGPGAEYKKVAELRAGQVFKIKSTENRNGQVWHQVYFDEWLRYPDRVEGDWYIPAVAGRVVVSSDEEMLSSSTPQTNKRIIVDLSDHMIYAYDGDKQFLATKVATGIGSTPTPTGTFTVYKKMPSRYMQGPLPGVSDVPFDLPGVPWNLYFTEDGAVIHGAYWHDRYGTNQSNGCINLPPELAKIVYDWASVGTKVIIQR